MSCESDCLIVEYCGICRGEIRPEYNPCDGGCPRGHRFHTSCIARWIATAAIEPRCPLCRGPLPEGPELVQYDLTFESARFYQFVAMLIVERPDVPRFLVDWLIEQAEVRYECGGKHRWLLYTPLREKILGPYPEFDANAVGLKFWPPEDLLVVVLCMKSFVRKNHVCSWECEETPCCLKRFK